MRTRRDRLLLALAQYQQGTIARAAFLVAIDAALDAPPDRVSDDDLRPTLSVFQAARRCQVQRSWILRWAQDGTIEAVNGADGYMRIVVASLPTRRPQPAPCG